MVSLSNAGEGLDKLGPPFDELRVTRRTSSW